MCVVPVQLKLQSKYEGSLSKWTALAEPGEVITTNRTTLNYFLFGFYFLERWNIIGFICQPGLQLSTDGTRWPCKSI